ncbi:MAG: DUF4870 domain-containing protein [Anaerolineales bacterium]
MKIPPTTEEKFWAALSHLSALAAGMGMMLPAFAWANNRKKSNYAAFQSLQALGYQSLGYTLWVVAYLVFVTFWVVIFALLSSASGKNPVVLNIWLTVFSVITVLTFGIYLLLPIIAAVQCGLGRDFRYPLLGDRLARYIGYDPAADAAAPLDDLHEERFAASMGHFCVIYPLWGLLVPVGFWAAPEGRSAYMKFQSLQIVIFQAIGTLVTFALGVIAFIILLVAALPFLAHPGGVYQPSMESILAMFIFLICLAVAVLVAPLYQIIGQWAGLRILQGRDYRYPLVGRWAGRWLAKRETAAAQEKA